MKKTVFTKNNVSITVAIILLLFNVNKGYAQMMFPAWPGRYAARLMEQIKQSNTCDTTKRKNGVKPKKGNRKDQPVRDTVFINRDKKLKDSVLKTWRY